MSTLQKPEEDLPIADLPRVLYMHVGSSGIHLMGLTRLSVCLSVWLSVCRSSVCLSVCLSVCFCVCVCVPSRPVPGCGVKTLRIILAHASLWMYSSSLCMLLVLSCPVLSRCVRVLSVSVSVSRPVLSQHAESKLCASFSRMPAYRCIPAHSACFLFRLVPSCPVVCLLVCGCLSVWPVLSCPFLSCPVLCVSLRACAAPGTVLSSGLCEVLWVWEGF